MRVSELLADKKREIITAKRADTITEAMELLISNKISCLLVVGDSNELVGVVSDKDIFKAVFQNRGDFQKLAIRDLMTTDLIVGLADDSVNYIAGLMTENRIRHIPVVDKKKLIGLVSQSDVIKTQMKHIEVENRYLRLYMDR